MAARLLAVLCAGLLLAGCQSIGSGEGGAETDGQIAPGLAELLEDPNMTVVKEAEVRRYFTGNTAYWEPLLEPDRLYATYYDPSGEQRTRERQATDVAGGEWRFDGETFCQTEPGSATESSGTNSSGAESCGAFVAGPDDVLVFCSEAQGCNWLVVGLNEGNSLSL